MPRSAAHNEIIRTARRDEIFRAAARVFAKKGFAATKIADIASEAGLSHGLLYHYYPSKEAVYAALLDEIVKTKVSRADLVRGTRSAIERIERILEKWLDRVTTRPEIGVLISQAYMSNTLPLDAREAFRCFAEDSFRELTLDLEEGQHDGTVTRRVPAQELAVAVGSLIRGLSVVRFVYAAVSPVPNPTLETVMRLVRPYPDEARMPVPQSGDTASGVTKVGSRLPGVKVGKARAPVRRATDVKKKEALRAARA